MRRWIFLIPGVILLGCQRGGGFKDIALVKQATREIRRIRNAIEGYKLDTGSYPGEGADLKVKLTPYLSKLSYTEAKDASKYSAIILGAQSNLNQIKSTLSGCGRLKEPKIGHHFTQIQKGIVLYEKELNGIPQGSSPIPDEIYKIHEILDTLNPEGSKLARKDSLITLGAQIIACLDSLIQVASGEKKNRLQNIKNTIYWYKLKLIGKESKKPPELYSPEGELADLKGAVGDTLQILELQEMLSYYRKLEASIMYCDFLLSVQKELVRASKLVSSFEEKRKSIKEAAVIFQAQVNLHKLSDALKDYYRQFGEFPAPNVGIDSLLHPYFIETTMSGEHIDRWHSVLKWFSSGPVYKTSDSLKGFVLEANANDKVHTLVLSKISVQNQWDKILKTFSTQPIYTTPDSTRTYFIRVRAKDSGMTWVTDRPPITRKGG